MIDTDKREYIYQMYKLGKTLDSGINPAAFHPTPETRNPKSETRNPKPETRNPKSETPNPKP